MDGLIAYALAKKYVDEHGGGGGGGTHTGTTAPDASIVANVGDFYYNTTNGDLYVCSEYISPTVTITDLTGYTFVFNNSIPFDTLDAIRNSYNINSQFPASSSPTWNQTKIYIDYYNGMTGVIVINFGGQFNVTAYKSNNNPQWVSQYQKIKFTGGTDATNSTFVNFVLNNATLDGVGSSWKLIKILPDATKTHSLLQANDSLEWEEHKGLLDLYDNNGSSNAMIRLNPGSGVEVWSGGQQTTRLLTDDLTFKRQSYDISTHREMFNLLGGYKDPSTSSISANTDLQNAWLCQPGNYGYVSDSVAATLLNCPTNGHGFTFKVLSTTLSYYRTDTAYMSQSYNLRIIITWDGIIYIQNVYYANSGSWYFGPWNRVTTSAEVPDAPTTDGNYVLKCSVSDGTPTYTWVEET